MKGIPETNRLPYEAYSMKRIPETNRILETYLMKGILETYPDEGYSEKRT